MRLTEDTFQLGAVSLRSGRGAAAETHRSADEHTLRFVRARPAREMYGVRETRLPPNAGNVATVNRWLTDEYWRRAHAEEFRIRETRQYVEKKVLKGTGNVSTSVWHRMKVSADNNTENGKGWIVHGKGEERCGAFCRREALL